MRARWAGLYVFLVAAALGVSNVLSQDPPSSATAPAEEAASPTADPACAFPDGLRDIGLYEKALEHYERLAATEEASCAADAYLVLVQTATAEAEATKASTPKADIFDAVRALDRAGFETEARELLAETLKDNAAATVPADLTHLDNNPNNDSLIPPAGGWSEIDRWWGSFTMWLVNWSWLLVTGCVFLIWVWRKVFQRSRAHVDIIPFNRALAKGDISVAMADLVQSSYEEVRLANRPANPRLQVDAPAAAESTAIVELVPNIGPILATAIGLVRTLWRIQYTLEGALIDDNRRGGGVALTLQKGNRVLESQTLWFSDFFNGNTLAADGKGPLDIDYLAMAETIAIWLHAKLADHQHPDRPLGDQMDSYSETWRSWEAYALFRNSTRIALRGDSAGAMRLLKRSLGKDSRFLPALLNHTILAITAVEEEYSPDEESTAGPAGERRQKLEDMARILDVIARVEDAPDRLRLSALYNKEALIDYLGGWPRTEPNIRNAPSNIDVLLGYVNGERAPEDGFPAFVGEPMPRGRFLRHLRREKRRYNLALKKHSETMEVYEYPIRAMAATIAIRKDIALNQGKEVANTLSQFLESDAYKRRENAYQALFCYSQACLYAAAFSHANSPDWGKTALRYLKTVAGLSPGLKEWASGDPSLTPIRIGLSNEFQEIVKQPKVKNATPAPPVLTEHVHYFRRWSEKEQEESPEEKK